MNSNLINELITVSMAIGKDGYTESLYSVFTDILCELEAQGIKTSYTEDAKQVGNMYQKLKALEAFCKTL